MRVAVVVVLVARAAAAEPMVGVSALPGASTSRVHLILYGPIPIVPYEARLAGGVGFSAAFDVGAR